MRTLTPITAVLGLALFLPFLAACQKPHSQVVREDASGRFNLIQAQMSFDQAEQAYETGQLDKALREIDVAIARYPEMSDYHLLRGRILLETNRLEPAMKSLDRALEINAENDLAQYFRGIVLQRWTEFADARDAYLSAFDLKHDNVQYLTAAVEMDIALGNFADARRLIEPRLTYFEHNAALHQLLGQIAMLERDFAAAAASFEEATLLDPDDHMLLEDLAQAQFSAQEYERAYQTIERIKQHSTAERSDLSLMEARCLTMTNRLNEARNLYLALSQQTPANPDVWVELGNVAFEVGDYRRVAIAASRAVALAPERFEGHLLMGLVEQNEGRLDAALANFQKAAELAPDRAWPHILLGMLHEQRGRTSDAASAYGAALRAEPGNLQARRLFEQIDRSFASEADSHVP